jgi:hypothetical protein
MFDAVYNSNLSDDGLPALMESFTNLDSSDQKVVARQIARRYCEMRTDDDLRSWKFDSAVLWQKIDSNRELVNEIGGCDSGFLYSPVYRD